MVRGNRFMALALSLTMFAQTVLPSALTTAYANQVDSGKESVTPVQMQSQEMIPQGELPGDEVIDGENGEGYVTLTLDANGGSIPTSTNWNGSGAIATKNDRRIESI